MRERNEQVRDRGDLGYRGKKEMVCIAALFTSVLFSVFIFQYVSSFLI